MAKEITKTAPGVRVMLAAVPPVAGVAITGPSDYGAWEEVSWLKALLVEERLAPAYHRAKFLLCPPAAWGEAERRAWRWRGHVAPDDRIAVQDLETGRVYFQGFIADVDATWSADESVVLTAVSGAYRLARDVVVGGRMMYPKLAQNERASWYTGLATTFNPGGVPNMAPRTDRTLSPVFTFDGDRRASWWTLGDVLDYLWGHLGSGCPWISAGDALPAAAYKDAARISVDLSGLSLWAAMAAACQAAGFDLAEECGEGLGAPGRLRVCKPGAGTRAHLKRQAAATPRPELDLAATNVFACSIAEATTPCLTRPVVAGGRDLVQVTVELLPAWDPAHFNATYPERYVKGELDFDSYADVCRLWDANTDGRYARAPFTQAVPDMAALADELAGSWPLMNFIARDLLVAVSPAITDPDTEAVTAAPLSRKPIVEWNHDLAGGWAILDDWRLAPDRLAIMLEHPDLEEIPVGGCEAGTQQNFLLALAFDKATGIRTVRLRLTCTIESPNRAVEEPALRSSAGTSFETREFFDRGELGQRRRLAASNVIGGGSAWCDTALAGDDLVSAAAAIQDAGEDRELSASLSMEWIDGAPDLTDVVEKIEGIEYDLATNRGDSKVYPRIVARTLHFENWSVTLQLGTERKAGTVFRPARSD